MHSYIHIEWKYDCWPATRRRQPSYTRTPSNSNKYARSGRFLVVVVYYTRFRLVGVWFTRRATILALVWLCLRMSMCVCVCVLYVCCAFCMLSTYIHTHTHKSWRQQQEMNRTMWTLWILPTCPNTVIFNNHQHYPHRQFDHLCLFSFEWWLINICFIGNDSSHTH